MAPLDSPSIWGKVKPLLPLSMKHTGRKFEREVRRRVGSVRRRATRRARIYRHQDWTVRFLDPKDDVAGLARRLSRFDLAAERGIEWSLTQLDRHSWPAEQMISPCYKGPLALVAAGRPTDAFALLERLSPAISADGTFLGYNQGTRQYLYHQGFLALGAAAAGHDRLFETLGDFVAAGQDPRTGGFWCGPPEMPERWMDTATSAIGGLALLRRGDRPGAERAADFLRVVFDSQPLPRSMLFTTVDQDGKLAVDPTLEAYRALDISMTERNWSMFSMPTWFLTRLYKETANTAHLELAASYAELIHKGGAWDRYYTMDAGKLVTAAAELYAETRKPLHAQMSLAAGAFIAGSQLKNGRWSWPPPKEVEVLRDIGLSFEYALWLELAAGALRP